MTSVIAVANETNAVRNLKTVRASISWKGWASYVHPFNKCVMPHRTMNRMNWKSTHLKGTFEQLTK